MIKIEQINIQADNLEQEPDCDNLELIVTRNLPLFPGVVVNFELGRTPAQELAQRASHAAFPIGIVCQIDPDEDSPSLSKGLYKYGVFADVIDVRTDAGPQPMAIVQARGRFRILGSAKPGPDGTRRPWTARVKPLDDIEPTDSKEFETAMASIRELAADALRKSGDPQGLIPIIQSSKNNAQVINILATNLPIAIPDKIKLLSKSNLRDRALGLLGELHIFSERVNLTEEIAVKARRAMDENQRNAFLQSQMEAIRATLYGEDSDEVDALIEKASNSAMPVEILKTFRKEAEKMRRFNPSSPDYSILYSYLETLLALPWGKKTEPNNNIKAAGEILESDHYGLEKVKQRILEQLAILFHKPDHKGTILCLVGPPGVGKTSVGQSVARALGRVYQRVSFGGLHDESEVRGHRRTYIGAMPGRIIDAIKRAGTMNPVILLDEIDKIGNDYKGDPAAALLEVLDPEQNSKFHDNYIDVDFDLSGVLFIATANTLSTIPRPLLDRMEIIEINGYLAEEKTEIARRHLIPRALKRNDLQPTEFSLPDDTVSEIITRYTGESGVRELDKQINSLARKCVLAMLMKEEFPNPVRPSDLRGLLGLPLHNPEKREDIALPGVVTGLAWTETGGTILLSEATLTPAKEPCITLTGNLGNVMKESATLAYQWIKANAERAGVDRDIFNNHAVHVHFPEGAIPKDGPSAGITITTAIVSALRGKSVRTSLAMTGEISLRGRVLPVGGIREKILAAKRAGITELIMSEQNRPDIEDMPQGYRDGLTFNFINNIDELLALAIV